jgi:cyanophycinase
LPSDARVPSRCGGSTRSGTCSRESIASKEPSPVGEVGRTAEIGYARRYDEIAASRKGHREPGPRTAPPLKLVGGSGPVALVGSGEYLPVMLEVEAALLAGRPPRYVQLPTAAAQEGPRSIARWVSLGREQATRLGVEAVPVMALDRESADDAANARQVAGAGLVYLSGGNPSYLAETLRGTRVWAAIVDAWRNGAALAGCSAGAMALGSSISNIRQPRAEPLEGLGVVPSLRVIPHFNRLRQWMPGRVERITTGAPAEVTVVGIDEDTAIVCQGDDLSRWVVKGKRSAWVLTADGAQPFTAGAEIVV